MNRLIYQLDMKANADDKMQKQRLQIKGHKKSEKELSDYVWLLKKV